MCLKSGRNKEALFVEILYQGTDITGMVHVKSCKVHDTCGERCDSLDIEFENAAGWYHWGPEEDDQIIVSHGGYNSGIMYLNMILPEEGRYRIYATSLPCKARKKECKSYAQMSIEDIMHSCAAVSGMESRIFGIDEKIIIPYAERDNEGCAAFLHRLLTLESAALKCVNGRYAAIGIQYAQDKTPKQTINFTSKQRGAQYIRNGMAYKGLTIKTPYAEATAEDTGVADSHMKVVTGCIPALNNIQAGRWARGKLVSINQKCESVYMQSDFNPGFTAMVRVDITGDTDANGEWLIEDVEHDLINLKTTTTLRRCIRTIR